MVGAAGFLGKSLVGKGFVYKGFVYKGLEYPISVERGFLLHADGAFLRSGLFFDQAPFTVLSKALFSARFWDILITETDYVGPSSRFFNFGHSCGCCP